MKPDTQKTTKGVKEAPAASEGVCPHCGGTGLDPVKAFHDRYEPCDKCGDTETKPRYTIELTTEGWQIKDNKYGTYLADVFGNSHAAELEAHKLETWVL